MAVLSIQSHVAYGHVGNRSAVFPLERLGFEVWPINTVQFSNHTGYDSWTGEVFTSEHIELVWSGIKARGVLGECEAVLSGYMGSAETGNAILAAVGDVKAANPGAIYCCDPVMGDYGRGLFVAAGIPEYLCGNAVRYADIVTPNQFEAELMADMVIADLDDAKRASTAIHEMGPGIVLITSFKPSSGDASLISMFLSEPSGFYTISMPELPFMPPPNGAGDLAAALFLGRYLRSKDSVDALELMTDSVHAVLERTLEEKSREIRIIQCQDAIAAPIRRFTAKRV